LQADERMVVALKLLLAGFENISGFKMNYSKSELIPLNLSDNEGNHLVEILDYKFGSLPIKYLGVSLQWKKTKK
jgi:hypothetical protein